jgi:RNA recognition motif-containing protein
MTIDREISGSDVPSGPRPIIAPRRISAGGVQDNPLSSKLYVGNLSFDSTEADLRDLFGRHGTVESVAVITDRETGRPRGFAFVEMSEASAAQDAIRALDGNDFGGRNIKVNEAQDRRGGGGGGGGGRGRY